MTQDVYSSSKINVSKDTIRKLEKGLGYAEQITYVSNRRGKRKCKVSEGYDANWN